MVKKEGFNREEENGKTIYTAKIIYHKDKEDLLLYYEKFEDRNKKDFSFHYSPYKMDSTPEKDFFAQLIDVVLIDTDYNGKVFNITYSDVPEKKKDLVDGKYELDIPKKKTTIALKIIDMLGEEVLVSVEI